MLKLSTIAKELGVAYSTVWNWTNAGILPCVHTPTGGIRVKREEYERLINNNGRAKVSIVNNNATSEC